METSPPTRERVISTASPTAPPPSTVLPSPTSNSSSTSSSSTNNHSTKTNTNGHQHHHYHHPYSSLPPPSTPTTPKQQQQHNHQTITRSESNNPYPTTFVQADTSSFKQVVQMLTGSSEKLASESKPTTDPDHQSHHHHHHHHHHHQAPSKNSIPPVRTASKLKPSRLCERRNSLKNFKINPLASGFGSSSGFSPQNADILSPSMLDFPSLALSPVTPLIPDPFNRSPATAPNCKPNNIVVDKAAEEKAIAEKGFYLHRSPASTPRESEPQLLPLFPVTSPRVSGSDSDCP